MGRGSPAEDDYIVEFDHLTQINSKRSKQEGTKALNVIECAEFIRLHAINCYGQRSCVYVPRTLL